MTTAQIPATSSAPTLLHRAAEAMRRYREQNDREQAEHVEREIESAKTLLVERMGSWLGIAIDPSAITVDLSVSVAATVEVEGFVFGLQRDLHNRYNAVLVVRTVCARGCGTPLWVDVQDSSLRSFWIAVSESNEHTHPCLQLFDDEGEPTTDVLGNPLPPREPRPPRLTPEEEARQAIDALTLAGQINISQMADERAAIEARDAYVQEMVRSLVGTLNQVTGKPHSATSAKEYAEQTERYAGLQRARIEAECAHMETTIALETAKLRAQLAVGLATADAMRNV